MATLSFTGQVQRFGENEERVNVFVNGDEDTDWTTSGGVEVPSLRKILKDSGINYLIPRPEYSDLLSTNSIGPSVRVTKTGIAGTFFYNTSLPNTTDGGTLFAHSSGVGAWERQFDGPVQLSWFGINDGTDVTTALQSAINATPVNGVLELQKGGVWGLGGKIFINKSLKLVNYGTMKVITTGVLGDYIFNITSDNVEFVNKGDFDGNNSLWSGVLVTSTAGLIYNPKISVGRAFKFNPTSLSVQQAVVNIASTVGGSIGYTRISDCGGYGVYTQFNRRLTGGDIQATRIAYAGFNVSGNVDCVFTDIFVSKTGYYGVKGGYAISGSGVTSDESPTDKTFTILKNAATKIQWHEGAEFLVIQSNTLCLYGKVQSLVDHGTYYTVNCAKSLGGIPVVGGGIELLDNSSIEASVEYTGDNGFDINIPGRGFTLVKPKVRFSGSYRVYGTPLELGAGIWFGADAQGASREIRGFLVHGVTILEADVQYSAGTAIQMFGVGEDITIFKPKCIEYNLLKEASGTLNPEYGGIDINRLTYGACRHVNIVEPFCRSENGFAWLINNALYASVKGGDIVSGVGGVLRDCVGLNVVSNPMIVSTLPGAAALDISSGSQNPTGVLVGGIGYLQANGSGSTAFKVSATAASDIMLGEQVDLFCESTGSRITNMTPNLSFKQKTGFMPANSPRALIATGTQKIEGFHASVNPGSSIAIASIMSGSGTGGLIELNGAAWRGTTFANEDFTVRAIGTVTAPFVVFTPGTSTQGGLFLDTADFFITTSGNNLTLNYKNNETDVVHIAASVNMVSSAT